MSTSKALHAGTMRDLTETEVTQLLDRQFNGRLGLFDSERQRTYVVPVSFVRRGEFIYLHSAPGLKLNLLRKQPGQVCLEVDQIADESEWRSVIIWGHFEEVTDPRERQDALHAFGPRLHTGPMRMHQNVGRGGVLGSGEVVYRLPMEEVSARADSNGWSATESD